MIYRIDIVVLYSYIIDMLFMFCIIFLYMNMLRIEMM